MNINSSITKEGKRQKLIKHKRYNYLSILIGVLTFISICYLTWQDYRKITIIQYKYVLLFSISLGLIIGTLKVMFIEIVEKNIFKIFKYYIWTTIVYGYLFWGFIVFTNIELSKPNQSKVKTSILARIETFQRGDKYVTLNINGIEKDIPFPNNDMNEINLSNYVVLTLNKGFWGIQYIVDKKLIIDYTKEESNK